MREGNKGYGILVSSAPKESIAIYSLRDPTEVIHIFTDFVHIYDYRAIMTCRIYDDIVFSGDGISEVACDLEVKSHKKPYIVYRREHTQL